MTDIIDDSVKKMKNTGQDFEAKSETTKDHAEGNKVQNHRTRQKQR